MSAKTVLLLVVLIFLFCFCVACVSLGIGNVTYHDGGLFVRVSNTGKPVNAGIQVRIYQIKGLEQRELDLVGTPAPLKTGENEIFIPVYLNPGKYKLFVYLTVKNERQTAVIRDIVV